MKQETKIITVIVVIAMIVVGIVGYLVLREKQTSDEIPYYFIAIHNEPAHDAPNSRYLIEEHHNILREMVEKANEYNIKLTLMISAQVADYIAEDPGRLAELKTWESQGHEIAAHHHSIYHGNWDGYTAYTEEEAIAERLNYVDVPETYLGTMVDYISHVKKVNPNVNSGCMNAEKAKMDFPDEIIYDTCSGYANSGEPGTLLPDAFGQKRKQRGFQ